MSGKRNLRTLGIALMAVVTAARVVGEPPSWSRSVKPRS